MQDFIVLGLIPGTNIQIGFLGWLIIAAVIIAGRTIVRKTRQLQAAQAAQFLTTYVSVSYATRRKWS